MNTAPRIKADPQKIRVTVELSGVDSVTTDLWTLVTSSKLWMNGMNEDKTMTKKCFQETLDLADAIVNASLLLAHAANAITHPPDGVEITVRTRS